MLSLNCYHCMVGACQQDLLLAYVGGEEQISQGS